MKILKAICTSAVLAVALSVPTYAGEVLTPGFTIPAPPVVTQPAPGFTSSDSATPVVTQPAPGEISSPGIASTNPSQTTILAELLLAILSIF